MNSSAAAPAESAADYLVTVVADFSALREHTARLQGVDAQLDFYSTLTWFDNLSRTGIEPELERLLVVVQNRSSGKLFCLPLLRRAKAAAAAYGSSVTSLSNYYSSLFGPIGDDAAVSVAGLRAALAHLKSRHGPCSVLDLQPLDTASPFYDRLRQALRAEGYAIDSYFCFGNWHLPVGGRSFAEYEPSIPSRLRNTYKRGRKKLDGAGPWTLQIHAHPGPELEAAIADFVAIYNKSWKTPEPFPEFVPGLCRAAAAQGWLRLGVVKTQDVPIAAQLWIVKHGHALIYKLAYDEEYKRFSAGSVLSAEMMRRAIDEDGAVDVDYLTGDDSYKVDWMSNRRERLGLLAFRVTRPQGLASLLKHRLGQFVRRRQAAAAAATAAAAAATVKPVDKPSDAPAEQDAEAAQPPR